MSELVYRDRPYHHGDLKTALLVEAEAILERDGIPALTLRAAARAAGVSHAAPANHFGDLTGLLSELAAVGFQRFTAALLTALEGAGDDLQARASAMGRAYVSFARAYPALFALMFRSERLDSTRPVLREAIEASRQALRRIETASGAVEPQPPVASGSAGRGSLVSGAWLCDAAARWSPVGHDRCPARREECRRSP